jgi:hypothetical protein
MSEQGGPYGPGGPGQPNQYGQGGQPPSGPQGWQQPNGPQGWQQPNQPPTGPQGWQQPNQPPTGPQGWQQPNQPPTGPQGWQQPNQPPTTQSFPAPGGPGQPWNGQQPGQPPKKNNKPLIITAIAVVVALIAGVGVYWFAIRDKDGTTTTTASSSGAASPEIALQSLVQDLGNSDPIGLADKLDPAEAKLFTDLNSDLITEFKRLEILTPAASSSSMTGSTIKVDGLTYGAVETINDHIKILPLTGGTITITSDPGNLPLSDKIKDAFGEEISQAQPQTQTVNIADAVADNNGEPIRIATVSHDGGQTWYVSLFYTIADNAVHAEGLPNPTTPLTPNGQKTPEAAAKAFVDAASKADLKGVIQLLPPDEMAVLYDYGPVLLEQSDMSDLTTTLDDAGVTISDVQWTTSDVTGGTKVSLASITLTAEGETVSIKNDGGVLTVTASGQTITLDESTIETYINQSADTSDLDPQLLDIIKREFKQIVNLGIVTVNVDGSWYVSPIRTGSDVFVSLLRGLEPADIDYFITLAGK